MYLIYVVSQNPYGIYDELKDIVVNFWECVFTSL